MKTLEDVAGYNADLHWRRPDERECQRCGGAWPCGGARRQLATLRVYIAKFWLDDERFAEMKAKIDADDTRGVARRAARKTEAAA